MREPEIAQPYVLRAGESRCPARHLNGTIRLLAGRPDTGEAASIFIAELGKGGPPLHVHDAHDESLLVLEGKLIVRVGDLTEELGPDDFAWLPRGVPHAFANPSDSPVRLFSVSVPGGTEEFLTEQADYFASLKGPPDGAKLAEIAAKHNARLMGPPLEL